MAEEKVLMVRLEDVHRIIKSIQDKYELNWNCEAEQPWGKDPTIYSVVLMDERIVKKEVAA